MALASWRRPATIVAMTNREARLRLVRKLTPLPPDMGNWYRACGDCLCECGHAYSLHPLDPDDLDWEGAAYMHVLCNGDRVKL